MPLFSSPSLRDFGLVPATSFVVLGGKTQVVALDASSSADCTPKVSCFEQLGIERDLLPRRIYAGHAKGLIHYFPLKMPVALGPEAAVFVYIDPGMGTRSELDSWGAAHRPLWEMLRESGWRVEVVAVAWDQALLDRAGRRLQSWVARDMSEGEKEALMLRQAIADTDWDTLERHGGFNAVVKKILQWEQENPASKGRGMIDNFRLWWSERCRQIGAHSTKGAWCAEVVRGPEPFSRRRPPPPPVAGFPGKMPESAPVKGCGEPLQPPPAEKVRPRGPFPRPAGDAPDGSSWRERPPFLGRWCGTGGE